MLLWWRVKGHVLEYIPLTLSRVNPSTTTLHIHMWQALGKQTNSRRYQYWARVKNATHSLKSLVFAQYLYIMLCAPVGETSNIACKLQATSLWKFLSCGAWKSWTQTPDINFFYTYFCAHARSATWTSRQDIVIIIFIVIVSDSHCWSEKTIKDTLPTLSLQLSLW